MQSSLQRNISDADKATSLQVLKQMSDRPFITPTQNATTPNLGLRLAPTLRSGVRDLNAIAIFAV